MQEDDYYGDGLNLYAYCRNNPVSYIDPSGHGTESAPDKWAENNRKDIQDLVDEMNHGNGASPSDVEAIKSLAEEFGLDPSEFDIKSSQEVNQQALKDLVDEVNKAGGASPSDQKILKEFAEEYGMDYDGLGVKEAGGDSGNTSWYNDDGSMNYPPNNGAVPGTERTISLKPGDTLGRYGNIGDKSNFVTQTGADSSKLSLPPNTDPNIYQEFVVVKEIPNTIQGEIAAWGDSTGGGLQYELPMPIKELIRQGYIEPR